MQLCIFTHDLRVFQNPLIDQKPFKVVLKKKRLQIKMDYKGKKGVKNPFERTNFISRALFTWIVPFIKNNFRRNSSIDDLYDIPKQCKSEECAEILSSVWEMEKVKAKVKERKPRLWKAILNAYKFTIFAYFVSLMTVELIFRIIQPICAKVFVQTFDKKSVASFEDQIVYATVFCLCSLLRTLFKSHFVLMSFQSGMKCRIGISSLIYRKAIRLQQVTSEEDGSTGQIVNLLSNDVTRFDNGLGFYPFIFVGPIQTAILLYLLWIEMGISVLAGVAFIVFIIPTQVVNAKLSAKFRKSVAKQTDKRIQVMSEILAGIKLIKMYVWEQPFAKVINQIRKKEMMEIRKRSLLRGFFLSLYTFSGQGTAFCIILAYTVSGNIMTADKAFFCVAVSNTIAESMVYCFSDACSSFGELIVSINRIEKFLLRNEQYLDKQNESRVEAFKGKIILRNVSSQWPGSEIFTLQNLNLELYGNKLVMIIGSVASGKTSLLNILISELPVLQGSLSICGTVSYATQEPWIFPGNLKQNILFGESFDNFRYKEVVRVCGLESDLIQLPQGDLTIVGDRGMKLSGGQKSRVNLARAMYKQADIYLMDDSLKSLDYGVSQYILNKCLKGFLKNKLRIFVTHQHQYLPHADHIILMKNGIIQTQGSYETLVAQGIGFMSMFQRQKEVSNDADYSEDITEETQQEKATESIQISNSSEQVSSDPSCTIWNYFASANSATRISILGVLFLCSQLLLIMSKYWLSVWSDSEKFKMNSTLINLEESPIAFDFQMYLDNISYFGFPIYLWIYASLTMTLYFITIFQAMGFVTLSLRISEKLHSQMLKAILRAPIKFYEQNSAGQILNRFNKDMGSLDETLPPILFLMITYITILIGVVVVIVISNWYMILPVIAVIGIFWILRNIFVKTTRDLKRLETIWKSPVLSHVSSSIQGLSTIRSSGSEHKMIAQFDMKQDTHTATCYTLLYTLRCFALWIEMVGTLLLTIVSFSFVLFDSDFSGGTVGLVITSTLTLSVIIQWTIRENVETENHMISVERILTYHKIEPEANLESTKDKIPPKDWPKSGEILFQNVSLSYDGSTEILKNLSFEIKSKEKIGIVGRTGAGKSSLVSGLLRLTESDGDIFIDGIKIKEICLNDLRRRISIISQDPNLFSGTVRFNLDPFNEFTDDELWKALDEVQLKGVLGGLDFLVSDGGANFSVGQRQLICLARTILRDNKIIILDEATSNVDPRTEKVIQRAIRKRFVDCSTITIAHKLHSVMHCDRVLVIDNGIVVEYDHPYVLLQNSESLMSRMSNRLGKEESKSLKDAARQNYFDRN